MARMRHGLAIEKEMDDADGGRDREDLRELGPDETSADDVITPGQLDPGLFVSDDGHRPVLDTDVLRPDSAAAGKLHRRGTLQPDLERKARSISPHVEGELARPAAHQATVEMGTAVVWNRRFDPAHPGPQLVRDGRLGRASRSKPHEDESQKTQGKEQQSGSGRIDSHRSILTGREWQKSQADMQLFITNVTPPERI
jgi:hypothetical protein